MKTEEKMLHILEKNCADALESGILVALSGGADSCALALLLKNLSCKIVEKHTNFRLCCAHFNHCIRGEAAREDENFVRAFCEKHALKLLSEKADVPAYAAENSLSTETAARELRYDFLERARIQSGMGFIATAHHLSDNAESILLHFLRGSGLNGLCGMKYCSGKIIHPLLEFEKKELVEYLLQNGEQFQTDETNFVPDTARNLLRLKIIPEIQNGINSSCEKVICRNAKLLNEDEKYLNGVAKEAYLNAKTENGVDAEKLIHLPVPIKSRAVMHMLRENGVQNDVFQPHIEALMKLLEMQSGAKIEMSTVIIRKSFGRLLVENKSCTKYECEINSVSDAEKKQTDFQSDAQLCPQTRSTPLPLNGKWIQTSFGRVKASVSDGGLEFSHERVYNKTRATMDLEKLIGLFENEANDTPADGLKIKNNVEALSLNIRFRHAGDMFFPVNAPGKTKLKKYLIAQKIDSERRDRLPLLECCGKIVYVYGVGISDDVKISNETKRIVYVEFETEESLLG